MATRKTRVRTSPLFVGYLVRAANNYIVGEGDTQQAALDNSEYAFSKPENYPGPFTVYGLVELCRADRVKSPKYEIIPIEGKK